MARGISLHFAVSRPKDCCNNSLLKSPPGNAATMARIATEKGFRVHAPVLDEAAHSGALLDAVRGAAGELKSGDILLLTFAGHGCQQPGANPDCEKQDQAWCLPDGKFLDNRLDKALEDFEPGVRILVVSDSCHSKTIVGRRRARRMAPAAGPKSLAERRASVERIAKAWGLNEECAGLIIRKHKCNRIRASVIVLSACEDPRTATEVGGITFFTKILDEVLRSNEHATYCGMMNKIKERVMNMGTEQEPGLSFAGVPDHAFVRQRPFTI